MFGGIGLFWVIPLLMFLACSFALGLDWIWRKRNDVSFNSAQGMSSTLRWVLCVGAVAGSISSGVWYYFAYFY